MRDIQLVTTRLTMSPIGPEDGEELYESVVRHDSVMQWLALGHAGNRADAFDMCRAHAAHWERHGYGDFAVRRTEDMSFLGRVGLRDRPDFGVDLGFAMAPRAEGKGFAREAGRACLDLAFGPLGLVEIFGFVLPDNERSVALLTRLGAYAAGEIVSSGNRCLRFRFDTASYDAR